MAEEKVRNQHYIPQFLLRKWGDPSKDYALSFFNPQILQSGIFKVFTETFPKRAAKKKEFYDPVTEYQVTEKSLDQLENVASNLISKILSERSLTSISPEERFLLAGFVYEQYARTPQIREGLTWNYFSSQRERSYDSVTPEEKRERRDLHTRWMFHTHHVEQIINLFKMKWILIENKSPIGFVLGDSPVMVTNIHEDFFDPIKSEYLFNFHTNDFSGFETEVVLPISPQFLLVIYDTTFTDINAQIPEFHCGEISKDQVISYNYLFIQNAQGRSYFRKTDEKFLPRFEKRHYEVHRTPGIFHKEIPSSKNSPHEIRNVFHQYAQDRFYEWAMHQFQVGGSSKLILYNTRFLLTYKKESLTLSFLSKKETMRVGNINLKKFNPVDLFSMDKVQNPSEWLIRHGDRHLKHIFGKLLEQCTGSIDHDFPLTTNYWKIDFTLKLRNFPFDDEIRAQTIDIEKILAYLEWIGKIKPFSKKKLILPKFSSL
ncbi:DUF4238 domain-containing protein [Candidatus Lokiarchaeum ossiferum]|uniref:DUF4238 domain-containing protein n=1 Tax=Candidatus Lokiarchaeum ossiferum TaxID=2951803 RepID=UPI00352D15E4